MQMHTFTFDNKLKTGTLAMMALGVLCLLLLFLTDHHPGHARFWSNVLHHGVFFTGIALMALFFLATCITAFAGWHTIFKRVWEAMSLFLPVGLAIIILIGIGNYLGWHHLYHWADHEAVHADDLLHAKSSFLNNGWYLFGTIVIGGIWYFFARKIRALSLDEDKQGTEQFSQHHKMRIWAAAFLPIAGFSSAAMVWQWVMSVDAHWYSTLFAWYCGASWFVSMICITVLIMLYLTSKGYFPQFKKDHLHDLGKFLFAFSIFWTYLWFSQFMLIWYGNVGEETIYFKTRKDDYSALFYLNLGINFLVPLLILMRNDTKRKTGSMAIVAGIVLLGHWLDYFLMIKPGVAHTMHELAAESGAHSHGGGMGFAVPGLLELGSFIGFIGLFLFVIFKQMEKASLIPANDPYLSESLHHHV